VCEGEVSCGSFMICLRSGTDEHVVVVMTFVAQFLYEADRGDERAGC
jgi:nitrogenase subunit NifH